MIKVSDYIVNFLVEKGIKDVFFIDGSACASLIVSVARNKNLQYYCNHHEQAGAFAIDGYYKASGKVAVMIATSGPAGQNLINGIAASYYDSIPAIYITGNINSKFMKPADLGIRQHGFQENDIVSMVKNITKRAKMITNPTDIKYELELTYHEATTGRPGTVLLDIPMNIQQSVIDENEMFCSMFHQSEISISHLLLDINNCIRMLRKAKRPVILIGGGVRLSKADKEVKQLIEELKIPVYVTWNMIDFCPNEYPYYGGRVGTFGGDGRNFGIQNCDLLLSIGSRISGRITGGMINTFARGAKKVIVDIDPIELNYQQVKGDLNIVCDAKIFTLELLNILKNYSIINRSKWLNKAIEWKYKYPVVKKEYWDQKDSVNPYVFVKVLSNEMKEGDVLVHEAGGNCVVTSQAFEAKNGQRVFSNNGNSSLGYAFPAAIGASIATKKQVICIVGDGGFQFNIQELQTAKHYMLPVKVFIFNNDAYGITKAYRDTNFQSEYAGVDAEHGQSNPDFIKVAEAYGIKTVKINNHSEMVDGIKEVLSYPGPVVCDVNMKGFYDYQPKLGWRNPIEDQYPFLPRDEFRQNMIIEPIEGWENPQYP